MKRIALPSALKAPDDLEQIFDLAPGEGCGRLVHDHDPGVDRKRARDADHVLLGDAQGLEQRAGIELDLELDQDLAGATVHRRPIDQTQGAPRLVADEDVLGDAELIEHHRLLVDRGDAGGERRLRRDHRERAAVELQAAGVGLIDAGQDLDQGRLAGAVLADQGRDLARVELEAHAVQRLHARERLADAGKLEDRLGHRSASDRIGQGGAIAPGAPFKERRAGAGQKIFANSWTFEAS